MAAGDIVKVIGPPIEQSYRLVQAGGSVITATGKVGYNLSTATIEENNSGSFVVSNVGDITRATAVKSGTIHANWFAHSSAGWHPSIFKNGVLFFSGSGDSAAVNNRHVSVPVPVVVGDYIEFGWSNNDPVEGTGVVLSGGSYISTLVLSSPTSPEANV